MAARRDTGVKRPVGCTRGPGPKTKRPGLKQKGRAGAYWSRAGKARGAALRRRLACGLAMHR
eukprot:scaffold32089_cov101-Isochrysis_galbana.AAC.1